MGNSHSAHQRLEDDGDGSGYTDFHEGELDSLPVAADDDQHQVHETLFRRGPSDLLFRSASSNRSLRENPLLQNANANLWNMSHLFSVEQSDGSVTEREHYLSDADELNNVVPWQAFAAGGDATTNDATLREFAFSTCSYLASEVSAVILGEDWQETSDGRHLDRDLFLESSRRSFLSSNVPALSPSIFCPWVPSSIARRASDPSTISDGTQDISVADFYPPVSPNYEWMGRSIETLLLGHASFAPVLALTEQGYGDEVEKPSTTEEKVRFVQKGRRSSVCSLDYERSPHRAIRRANRRRKSSASSISNSGGRVGAPSGGPNVLLSLLARETTGKPTSLPSKPPARRLRDIGGTSLHDAVNKPSGGIVSEVVLLEDALDHGDWVETQTIVSRLAPRLIGDPMDTDRSRTNIEDPSIPPSVSRLGGRVGYERDTFVLAGGVKLLLRILTEPAFVGDELSQTNDARDLSEDLVNKMLAGCWNETLASLRELVYAMPRLIENGDVLDDGDFVPYLFTLLAHDACFEAAAALIEEILSVQSQCLQQYPPNSIDGDDTTGEAFIASRSAACTGYSSIFFLGNVPNLYELWGGFTCCQLAHFCRILVPLIFEPEDRQVLESPAVLKSIELLQLRRDRAARAGRDSAVDMNQALLLGDVGIVQKLLMLLRVMNFGPPLTRRTPYQVMAHFPFIGDTLQIVGLSQFSNWNEIERLDDLARLRLSEGSEDGEGYEHPSDLGTVADMLESLSGLRRNALEQSHQLGRIISVINAAQRAGVIVGTSAQSRSQRRLHSRQARTTQRDGVQDQDRARSAVESLAAAAATLAHQDLLNENHRVHINTPEDAANELQFNAFSLAPFQVEVLFVLCTLLGCRRKLDVQIILRDCGLIPILEQTFHRLSFRCQSPGSPTYQRSNNEGSYENGESVPSDRSPGANEGSQQYDEVFGMHGPGCECTPESAIIVQFLRVLHNFCDRDCDNHTDRRLLLSSPEREFLFSWDGLSAFPDNLQQGLLSRVITAFLSEPDDSPYRFWLASCIESFIRGSCVKEQLFVAQTGLLLHLLDHITCDRLHCSGSLQTSFDLLGEMCKGNLKVLRLLMAHLDDLRFQKLMNVATSNLVDSNVFIRALILSFERHTTHPRDTDMSYGTSWESTAGLSSRFYLTHSWWDPVPFVLNSSLEDVVRLSDVIRWGRAATDEENCDNARPSDWFPPMGFWTGEISAVPIVSSVSSNERADGHDGWVFSPPHSQLGVASMPHTIERLGWFLDVNRPQLLCDLLSVVDLLNINHENICCLNTVVIIVIFAHRHNTLGQLIQNFKKVSLESKARSKGTGTVGWDSEHEIESAMIDTIQRLEIGDFHEREMLTLEASPPSRKGLTAPSMRNERCAAHRFRELLWFWTEYYTHRGRDRLSLEFSCHLHFHEWKNVISTLMSDDGSSTSLLSRPIRLPRSPYQRAPRVADTMESHARGG